MSYLLLFILVLGYGKLWPVCVVRMSKLCVCLSCAWMSMGGASGRFICSGSRVTWKSPSRLQGRSPSQLQLYFLYLRKAGFYPYLIRSFLMSCAVSSPDGSCLE